MVFGAGNVITILLVLIILMIYRRLDTNNRSLEKVKRYAERVERDLDVIVEQRATVLKDMGIELEVNQKAARELLNRIQQVEEGMKTRADRIEGIGGRIDEYDGALQELVEMTRRAEENIARIRTESDYIDKVGKRLKLGQERLSELEQGLPRLLEQFTEQNASQLNEVEQRIESEAEQRARGLEREITVAADRVAGFEDFLKDIESRADDIALRTEGTMEKSFQQISEQLRSLVEESGDSIEERFARYRSDIAELDEEYQQRLAVVAEKGRSFETEALSTLREDIQTDITALRARLETELNGVSEQLGEKYTEFNDRYHSKLEKLQDSLYTLEETLSGKIQEVETRGKSLADGVLTKINQDVDAQTHSLRQDMEKRLSVLNSEADASFKRIDMRFGELQEKVENKTEQSRGFVEALEERVTQLQTAFQKQAQELEELAAAGDKQAERIRGEFAAEAEGLESEIKGLRQAIGDKLEKAATTIEATALGKLENRLGEYEKELGYRFGRIESVSGELEQLETALKANMERAQERLSSQFTEYRKQLADEHAVDTDKSREAMAELWAKMDEIEQGVADLKQRAYDNVSEKLKVFEDEFFADLRERGAGMEESLEKWRKSVDQELLRISDQAAENLQESEDKHRMTLEAKMLELGDIVDHRFAGFEKRANAVEAMIEKESAVARTALQQFAEQTEKSIESTRLELERLLKTELETTSASGQADIKRLERTLGDDIEDLQRSVGEGRSDISGELEQTKSELAVWQAQVSQQLKSSEADLKNQFVDFKVGVSGTLSELKDEFQHERDELVAESRERRESLKSELTGLGSQVSDLREDLEKRTEAVLEDFQRQYRQMMSDLEEQSRELQGETDSRTRELRGFLQDTREQFDSLQQKLFGRIEDEARILEVTLNEIDKRQKSFIEQTRVFERADSLKIGLQEDIEALKGDLARVEAERAEIREIEAQFSRIRKLATEAGEKMGKFTAEKRRIDALETDFQKVLSMAATVDTKLEQVGADSDLLQEVQTKLRAVDDLQKQVADQFVRLEKKQAVIESTADGVDKNFEYLDSLEKRLSQLQSELGALPKQVDSLKVTIRELSQNKKSADEAAKQISGLSKLMTDVEQRAESLQAAREWLARTETRLEQVAKEAEDQIKLLATLVKKEGKAGAQRGAPPEDSREAVVKLAKQGWKVEEIARATQVSRGEVELILELSGKKS
ncbi:MAG: hypothetical protein EA428_07530 [Spirochaetaceae bacterium]|nr:MAG: hypothetical protein EA428_07530 [Spirochaetaceae bacterium]